MEEGTANGNRQVMEPDGLLFGLAAIAWTDTLIILFTHWLIFRKTGTSLVKSDVGPTLSGNNISVC